MLKCKSCGAELSLTMSTCPACGAEVQMARLTGLLGIVCRACDAYNEPTAKTCASCGQSLGGRPAPAAPSAASPGPEAASAAATPAQPAPVVVAAPKPAVQIPIATASSPSARPRAAASELGAAADAFGALKPGRAKLVLERGEGFDGATYRLNAAQVAAGRSRGAILFPSDATLAPQHATFFYRNGALYVRDEGAPGGVYVKLRELSVPLRPGDLFVVGDRLLRFAGPLPPPPQPLPDGTRRLGSPRPAGTAILVEERLEGGAIGRVYLRPGPSVTIGRAGCSINLGDDPYLSQAHAEIAIGPEGSARLRDLGSSNGTFVPIPARTERELRGGDVVRLGREVLRVVMG